MNRSFISVDSVNLPRWIVIAASTVGLLALAVGMSRIVRYDPLSKALPPMVLGSVVVYICGFKKRLSMDQVGVSATKSFWGRKKENHTVWEDVTDARVILNKGKNIYVLLHSADKIPTFTLNRSDIAGVVALLREKLPDDRIKIEE